jgi:putative ABC transport system permease protein
VTVTRAYRVNLNMLALVALFTGAFLVFSTQSLSVMRRSPSLALLRALGVTQGQLRTALLGEGIALGMTGALLGIVLGNLIADAVLHYLAGDLGNGQLHTASPSLRAAPAAMLGFFLLGAAVAGLGAWIPARSIAKLSPARTLKGGGGEYGAVTRRTWRGGMVLLGAGSLLALPPAIRGLPIFGYVAVATLLFGAVLLVPALTVRILQWVPRGAAMIPNLAVAQLRENVSVSTLNLASIIVSFSLMVAMAIMVYSFRQSFDQWLDRLLPADLQLREPFGNDTAYWSKSDQAKLADVPGVARAEFRRTRALLLDPARPPVTLIARGSNAAQVRGDLPLMKSAAGPPPAAGGLAWISESLRDVYGYEVGDRIRLPLGSRMRTFEIEGIWRDYARVSGAVVITRPDYIAATADTSANEGSVWLQPGAEPAATAALLRERVAGGGSIEIMTTTVLHERSLQIFDRAFAITYALEAIAVIIGLMGVSFGASSTALSRRAEFGMLRHIGLLRRQVMAMLASEGVLMSVFGAAYGLALGGALSLVLIYVISRQSFHWSIDLSIPLRQLLVLSATLVGAAALTAVWGGRAAMSQDAVRAVREDW